MVESFPSIKSLAKSLRSRTIGAVELTKEYLKRIKEKDKLIKSYITVTEDIALEQAQKAQKVIDAGDSNLMTGIPIAHKDLFCTKGVLTTCGSKMLSNFISPYDATVVEKLNNVNAVMLGKLNMDEFAMGSSTEYSYYGPTSNPWDIKCVPGGSSGGAAAAVMSDLAVVTTGTDTGGSIRQPAALCGATGIRATYGRISRYGMIAFASSLDQAGVLGRSAEDLAISLASISGHDTKDSTSSRIEVDDYLSIIENSIKGKKIGLPKEFFADGLEPEIETLIQNGISELQRLGAQVKEVSLPNLKLAIPVYYVLAPAEASSNLGRYDGIKYGHRATEVSSLEELYEKTRYEGFGKEVKRRIMIGTLLLTQGYYEKYYQPALRVRTMVCNEFKELFKEVDILLGPTTPGVAFPIGEKQDKDPVQMYLQDIYTISVNLAGLPALSMPVGLVNNLPVGMQIIGPAFSEGLLLNITHQFQQKTDFHKIIPFSVR